jgi:hypothetical protein
MGRTAINVMLADVNKANLHILDSSSERQARSETSDAPPPHRHAARPHARGGAGDRRGQLLADHCIYSRSQVMADHRTGITCRTSSAGKITDRICLLESGPV